MGRVYRTDQEWAVIKKRRKEQHGRLETIAHHAGQNNLTGLLKTVGLARPYIDNHYRAGKGERDYTPEFISILRDKFPYVNIHYFLTGEGNPLSGPLPSNGYKSPEQNVDQNVQEESAGYQMKFLVKDDTMSDFIKRGDTLIVREIPKESITAYGEPHVFYTSTGVFLRYVWPAVGGFVLKAHDPAKVPDMNLSLDNIKQVKKVVKLARDFE